MSHDVFMNDSEGWDKRCWKMKSAHTVSGARLYEEAGTPNSRSYTLPLRRI